MVSFTQKYIFKKPRINQANLLCFVVLFLVFYESSMTLKRTPTVKKKAQIEQLDIFYSFFPIVKMIYLDGKTSIKLKLGGG